jgi:hypothetical protein
MLHSNLRKASMRSLWTVDLVADLVALTEKRQKMSTYFKVHYLTKHTHQRWSQALKDTLNNFILIFSREEQRWSPGMSQPRRALQLHCCHTSEARAMARQLGPCLEPADRWGAELRRRESLVVASGSQASTWRLWSPLTQMTLFLQTSPWVTGKAPSTGASPSEYDFFLFHLAGWLIGGMPMSLLWTPLLHGACEGHLDEFCDCLWALLQCVLRVLTPRPTIYIYKIYFYFFKSILGQSCCWSSPLRFKTVSSLVSGAGNIGNPPLLHRAGSLGRNF